MAARKANDDLFLLNEQEILSLMTRYPGLGRMDVLHAIVRAGPKRKAIDAAVARMWEKRVLSVGRYIH